MPFEVAALLEAILLGLIYISAAAFALKKQTGNAYAMSPRDEPIAAVGRAGRLSRAQRNFEETFPYFLAAIVAVMVSGPGGAWSWWGCVLYLAGRTLYLPLYALGLSPWRSFAWNAATLGIPILALQPLLD